MLNFLYLILVFQTEPSKVGFEYLTSPSFNSPTFSLKAWNNLYQQWGLQNSPSVLENKGEFWKRYGLLEAPFNNQGIPLGLKLASVPFTFGKVKGIALDCLICHSGKLGDSAYLGMGNSSLDLQSFFEDMHSAEGRQGAPAIRFGNTKGTNEAGAISVFLIGFRNPDLSLRTPWTNLGLNDTLYEDVPAWWLLKKKKTMYATGGADARSVRSLMQFMMSPIHGPNHFHEVEKNFSKLQSYILSIQPPKYPHPIKKDLAAKGRAIFENRCSRCHGTYGESWTYPNKVIPLPEIGTDPLRFHGISKEFGKFYNASWFSKEKEGWIGDGFKAKETSGYQAPPLDGIWATSPYLHNGSVPTIYHLLKSSERPEIFSRSFENRFEDLDQKSLGWMFKTIERSDYESLRNNKIKRLWYDTKNPGQSNNGHTYGDSLREDERLALIEYLKTL